MTSLDHKSCSGAAAFGIDLASGALSAKDWFHLSVCASQRADILIMDSYLAGTPELKQARLRQSERESSTAALHFHSRYLRWPIR
jgi:hypothetical protein